MADNYPYTGVPGALIQVLDHLRKSFPPTLNADTLKKLGYAPKNESYILNTLRFLEIIDDQSKRTEIGQKIFTAHDTQEFQEAFSGLIKKSYNQLFSLHAENSWALDNSKLITFFRQTDQSSELVGKLKAKTFKTLATYAGHEQPGNTASPSLTKSKIKAPTKKSKSATSATASSQQTISMQASQNGNGQEKNGDRNLGLTVRIEINLPAQGDQATYDKIFKSIRENLLNG